jgi:NADP-dependent 3-hydroxy acid dehydrogenase YdfG
MVRPLASPHPFGMNNAGVAWRGTLDTYDREQVAHMRQVNVEGMIHATRAVMGGMRARRYGWIVNLSSVAAIGTALPGNAFYAATKADAALCHGAGPARHHRERGGARLRPHRHDAGGRGAGDWQGTEERFAARAMMGRIGEPEDIANAVVFLDYIGHG